MKLTQKQLVDLFGVSELSGRDELKLRRRNPLPWIIDNLLSLC
jgi:hypothetical protein